MITVIRLTANLRFILYEPYDRICDTGNLSVGDKTEKENLLKALQEDHAANQEKLFDLERRYDLRVSFLSPRDWLFSGYAE